MTDEKHQIDTARASPTKAFFVSMLTRDIDLADAILDLLDNCLDGILRTGISEDDPTRPYAGYRATLTMAADHFIIEDNCGGIPIDTAKRYAFAMGRPSGAGDPTPATIGMYGIGMKRAIFKLGVDALVESRNDQGFNVEITQDWMRSDEWSDLPMYELTDGSPNWHGTRVSVLELNPEAAAALGDASWVDSFRKNVARTYSLILNKGFEVVVGSPEEIEAGLAPIAAEPFLLLRAEDAENPSAILPYVYRGTVDDVQVEIFAGIYRKLLTEEELAAEEEGRSESDNAGWTVACNDRVVIWKDKTRLTGWGEANVPNYHGQFIAITGIVLLHADDPRKLPLTTTKRGIDASSNVYSTIKDLMREATKSLTTFTNKWKRFPRQREDLYQETRYADLHDLRQFAEEIDLTPMRNIRTVRRFEPNYPTPAQESTSTRVSFVAEKTEIRLLAKHFFDTEDVKPDQVGKAAFDQALADARGGK